MKLGNYTANSGMSNQYLEQAKNSSDKALNNIAAQRALSGADSANLVIADSLRSQSSVLEQGIANSNDAIAMLQIADAALENLTKSADRLNEISVAMSSATLSSDQKNMLAREANILTQSMQDSIYQSSFNGKNVFIGEMNFSTGDGMQNVNLAAPSFSDLNINDQRSISSFTTNINALRSKIGSTQNAIVSGINASVTSNLSLKLSESNMQRNDVANSASGINLNGVNISASLLAQIHNISSLQGQIGRLLG